MEERGLERPTGASKVADDSASSSEQPALGSGAFLYCSYVRGNSPSHLTFHTATARPDSLFTLGSQHLGPLPRVLWLRGSGQKGCLREPGFRVGQFGNPKIKGALGEDPTASHSGGVLAESSPSSDISLFDDPLELWSPVFVRCNLPFSSHRFLVCCTVYSRQGLLELTP